MTPSRSSGNSRPPGRMRIRRWSCRIECMYKTLSPGAIGVKAATVSDGIAAAKIGGFSGLEVSIGQLADLLDQHGTRYVKGMFADAGVRPAAFGLPTDWLSPDQQWQ